MNNELVKQLAHLSPEERELLELLLAEEGVDLTDAVILPQSRDSNVFAVSFAQQRLWFLDQLEPGSAQYNIPLAIRLTGELDVDVLARAFNAMVTRHEVLRTTFTTVDDVPMQVIAPSLTLELPLVDLQDVAAREQETRVHGLAVAEAQRPFHLQNGPLIRSQLLRLAPNDHVILVTMHHSISDGWSMGILTREVMQLYAAFRQGRPSPLPPLEIQYADFAVWQRERLQGDFLAEQLDFWKQQLAGSPPLLNLPTDRPRPLLQTSRGARHYFHFSNDLLSRLHKLSQEAGATLFMTLLAAFQTLLHRYARQDDINVGTPIANRNRAEIEELIGFFVNTLVIRADFADDPTFSELLAQVRDTTLAAYDHQDVPFDLVVEAVQPERDLSHTPLFQAMFLLQNNPVQRAELPGLTVSPVDTDTGATTFDLTLGLGEQPDGLAGSVEYNADLFDAETIEGLVAHFGMLLEGIAANPDVPVSRLPLLTEAERQRLVVEWNDTAVPYPLDQTIHQLFEAQVERMPEAAAVIHGADSLTYAQLNARANQLAHFLRKHGVGPDVLVGISLDRSLDLSIALLGILKAGGAYLPLDPAYPDERLAYMVDDAQPAVLLTNSHLTIHHAPFTINLAADWPTIAAEPDTNPGSVASADNLAYVIYTSGSTGKPKGVQIEHHSVVNHNLAVIDQFQLSAGDRALLFSTINFDAAVEQIFPTWLCGAALVMLPNDLPGGPRDLLRLADAQRLTVLNLPTAYWHELTYELSQGDVALPDTVRLVVVGGEKASAERLAQWERVARDRVTWLNTYGPTETTIISTLYANELELNGRDIPIGRPIANTQVYVLDANRRPVPIGAPGELYIGGAGVARGYLNRPNLTAERFINNPFTEGTLYRTGDLVRYRADGQLEFLGRADDQVKIRGFRVELGEIEAALNQYPALREGVVVALDGPAGRTQLVAYVVPANATVPTTTELRRFLAQTLPDYMLPALFVSVDAIPRTPSGKLNRRALPAPEAIRPELEAAFVAPRTPQEELLANIWAELLHIDAVGVEDNFFELGGHSLLATQLASRVRAAFGVELQLRKIFEAPTVAALATRIELAQSTASGLAAPPLEPVPRQPAMPVSYGQQRLWFLDQLEPGSAVYNIPDAVRLRGALDVGALQASLNEIVRRHEVLRTTFDMVDGRPVQIIHPNMTIDLPVIDLTPLPAAEREAQAQELAQAEAQRPFSLQQGPLVRAQLLRLANDDHVALFTMHHIVSDGWSSGVLVREVGSLYQAFAAQRPSPLEPLPLQYADFAHWQRDWLQGEVLDEQLDYWRRQLAGAPPRLELPVDHPRPALQSNRGNYYTFELHADLLQQLEKLSQQAGTTLFMTLLAAFQALLSRYTRQDDISVGTPIANRSRAEIEGLIGFFVNTLVLRTRLDDAPSYRELLRRVREVTLGAYAHQDVPFEMVVDAVQPERNLSHTPLFQVMFMLHSHNPRQRSVELPGLHLEQMKAVTGVAMFDLTLALQPGPDGISGGVEYNADLFEEATIARLMRHFRALLEGAVAAPDRPLPELPLLDEAERRQILVDWNDTAVPFPHDQTLHRLFAQQAARTPEATAVMQGSRQLTYAQLDARANQLAHHLRAAGAGPGTLVGISVARSLDMYVGLLGILKAGAAYVPLDPDYPPERLAYMIEDANLQIVVTDARSQFTGHPASLTIHLTNDWPTIAGYPTTPPTSGATAADLAYVIYTSGSTGRPKGVQITHRSVINHNWAVRRLFELTSADRVLQFMTINFDAAVEEIFPTWFSGATLVLRDGERLTTTAELLALIEEKQLTLLDLPTAYWHQWVYELSQTGAALPESLRLVVVGGEKAAADRLRLWRNVAGSRVQWLNTYGPTETTIISTAYRPDADAPLPDEVPIGRPIANTQTYILDETLQPVPIGVPGELCIGGSGVARGYLNRPELTAETFIPDPFRASTDAPSDAPTLYRTGDLARWLPDGSIEFLGRADAQVKIRGFRVELGEIEAALKALPAVQDSVVTARSMESVQRLVAYVIPAGDSTPSTSDLRASLGETLPDYMIPSYFVPLASFPLTPSGKVNRRALPAPDGARPELEAAYAAPRTPAEEKLAAVWASVLGVDKVGIHDNFFELGGDSILSIQVIARAKQVSLHLTPRQLFEAPTVAGLAAVAGTGPRIAAEQGIVEGRAPLTPIQRWFFEQAFAEPQHWNQALLFRVRQPLNKAILEATLAHLLRHHDALRLRFAPADDGWLQTHAPAGGDVPLAWVSLADVDPADRLARVEALAADYQASLDLSQGPLLRVVYFDLGAESNGRILIIVHHLAVDGVSWRILLEDLQTVYQQLARGGQAQLPPKSTAFQQWAERLVDYAQTDAARAELAYWTAVAQAVPTELPRDFPAGSNSEAAARSVGVRLTAEETDALLRDVPPIYRTEINDVLLAALGQAVARWTGQPRTLVELESFGREDLFEDVDTSRTVGWFTAVYPVHLDLTGLTEQPGEALKAIKEQLRQVPRRGVGYGVLRYLCQDTAVRQQMVALPQPQISFNYLGQFDQGQNQPNDSPFAPAEESRGPDRSPRARRTHLLEIDGAISNGRLSLEWTFSAEQFRSTTIERVAQDFLTALRAIIDHCRNPEAGGVTPSDFPLANLDQKQLDKVLSKMQGKRRRR